MILEKRRGPREQQVRSLGRREQNATSHQPRGHQISTAVCVACHGLACFPYVSSATLTASPGVGIRADSFLGAGRKGLCLSSFGWLAEFVS